VGHVELTHLDAVGTLEVLPEVQAVYRTGFPGNGLRGHRRRMRRHATRGLSTVTARSGGALIGFAYGVPLAVGTTWWDGLQPAPDPAFLAETGSRTFAVIDLAVVPSHRGQGVGRTLLEVLLRSRSEPRATLATGLGEVANQAMYERWGWQRLGRLPARRRDVHSAYVIYVKPLA
jgi:ribosomal protein S18 acetylase RimI-like enzyme